MSQSETAYTVCECHDPAHVMEWVFDEDPTLPELYLSVQLNPAHPWWRRAWIGLRYALGRRSRYSYGHWDEGSFSEEGAKQAIGILSRYLVARQKATGTWTA